MTSSAVYERGAAKYVATTWSIAWPSRSSSVARCACHDCHGAEIVRIDSATRRASAPDRRTTPSPPRPSGVEIAAIVSFRFIVAQAPLVRSGWPARMVLTPRRSAAIPRTAPATASAGAARTSAAPLRREIPRRFGQAGHPRRIDHHLPRGPGSEALAPHLGFAAQRHVDDSALAAVHRVETERLPGPLYLFRRRHRAEPQLLDAQQPVVVGVERDAGMVLGGHPQHLHGQVLEREQQLRFV